MIFLLWDVHLFLMKLAQPSEPIDIDNGPEEQE